MKLPKPRAVLMQGEWMIHHPGTYTKSNPVFHRALADWLHSNWTRSRIMRTIP
jgi:hypothetical protein